jgi:transcriptional regulator with XRE-family HTH domain
MDKKNTIKDIAKQAGVSVATISYVINNRTDKRISEETRKKVLQIVNLLDYKPNSSAKSLSTSKTYNIALYMMTEASLLKRSEQLLLTEVLSEVLSRYGYHLMLQDNQEVVKLNYADAILCFDATHEFFLSISDKNLIAVIAIDSLVNIPWFFQVCTDYTRLKKSADDHFGYDNYTYLCLPPNNELLKGKVNMLANGAVLVDEYMRTSNPDIYAAGDSCAVHYNPNGGQAYIPLATNAVRMGMLVGKNILEPKVKYRGTQSTSGLHLFGYNIGSTGVTQSGAAFFGLKVRSVIVKDNYRPEFMPTNEEVLMQLVYEIGTNRIVGGQVMSKYDITQSANTLSLAIQNKMTIEDLAYVDFFFQPHFDRPWNYLNLLAQGALEQERRLTE